MKIKILISLLSLICVIMMNSCGDAMNSQKCLNNVKLQLPKYKIYLDLDHEFTYIAIDTTNTVFIIECMNMTNTQISKIEPLIKIQ